MKAKKLPKARVMWGLAEEHYWAQTLTTRKECKEATPIVAIRGLPTKQARALARFFDMTEEERVRQLVDAIKRDDEVYTGSADAESLRVSTARAILKTIYGT